MISKIFKSLKDNIQGKVTNPFFGTLIIVWCIHNYEFLYTFFNFEKGTCLSCRNILIGAYIDKGFHWLMLLECIGYTFVAILISYLLMGLTRLFIQFYDRQINPLIFKFTDKGSVVLKAVFEAKEQELSYAEKRFNTERDDKLKLQTEYDKLEQRYKDSLQRNNVLLGDDNKIDLTDERDVKLESNPPRLIISEELKKTKQIDVWLQPLLKDEELISDFNEVSVLILKNQYFDVSDKRIDNLLLKNLVESAEVIAADIIKVEFTEKGQILKNYLLNLDTVINTQDILKGTAWGKGGMLEPPLDVED